MIDTSTNAGCQCGGASMTSVESWYLIALKNALGAGMRKGKMRRVSALEVLQCCSAAVLRTPMLCSDQHNTAIWLDMGVGVSGGSLQFIYKGGNFNDITIRHVLYHKPWQESVQKISSTNFKKRKKGCKYFWALFSKSLRGYFSSKVWNNRLSLVSLCSWPGTERAEASKVEIWMVEEANMVAK